jgi:beta-1,4-mannosyl-glycoprotein beta-1,4-N-acetylglucosaminyltransferase
MVYDCFIFFNELDLLEIRLNELKDVVDKFVIVESTETFSKKKKKLYYEENKGEDRFLKFKDKIIHVIVNDSPEKLLTKTESENRWDVEHFQRNCISRGLTDCKLDDVILVSDVDELPRTTAINKSLEILNKNKMSIISFRQRFFYYFLNGLCVEGNDMNSLRMSPWLGTTACRYEGFIGAEKMRMTKGRNKLCIDDSGWHFSYLGGPEKIAYKIESFSHSEFDNNNIKNKDRIVDRINKGIDLFDRPRRPRQLYVKIDASFPDYLKNNIDKFKHLIREVT